MNLSGKILALIMAGGFVLLIAGVNLLYTKYDVAGIICTALGIVVLIPTSIATIVNNLVKKRKEPKVQYGRYDKTGT